MLPTALVIAASFAYLMLLFAVAWAGDARARQGRSIIGNAWVYSLSMGVYCTAWTYFGSIGRAASAGLWFLPIYLGPTLGMLVAWMLLRKMIRIARVHRITSIADFIGSRYGKSRLLAALVTLIAVVGIVPYVALQLKAIATGYALLANGPAGPGAGAATVDWWRDGTLYMALVLAGFTIAFGTRHLDSTERHEGMVAAIAVESVVKLLAFLAIGVFVTWGLFDGPGDIFRRASARADLKPLLGLGAANRFAGGQWFALTLLSMLSLFFLPRQFQMMVVENVDERHVRRAAWAFPLYLLLINLFVMPIALGGLLHPPAGGADAETFVLSLPLAAGHPGLALLAFVGGLSAATGMIIVEAIAVSTMVCNDLVIPLLLRRGAGSARDLTGTLLGIRRGVIVVLMLLGYLYFRIAGEAYALVSIGLISFAAVAQFAPALLGGMYWKGGTRAGALAGLTAGFALWIYTLMLPSIAKSGWMPSGFMTEGLLGFACRGRTPQRDDHEQPGIGQQTPQQRMRQAVQSGQPEQLLGFEQRDPEQPLGHEARRHPARLGDRRQHQRVDPEREAGAEAGERAGPRAAFPVHAAEQRGRELRDRGEADQADADERVRLARDPEVQVAEQQQRDDHAAADAEQRAGQVARARPVAAQEERDHEVVADHRRDGDRLDDDHPGRSRQPADEGDEREPGMAGRERQRQHEGLGAAAGACRMQQPAERDRQHEHVDQQQVQRERPRRAPDVALVDVLDDHHLELARQEEQRQHRQQGQREPLAAGEAVLGAESEQRLQVRPRRGPREDVAGAREQAPGDERADGEERDQLDDRLHRDRGDHALVTLGGVEVPGAEGDREAGEHQRDVEGAVAPPGGAGQAFAGQAMPARQQGISRGDRLQLQRDIRDDADDCDQRYQRRESPALAIATADQIGDRRDAMDARDADHLAQHHPRNQHPERRT
ncbi:MAG TPA: hypothetical protein VLD35_02540 [Caldimonas sp.]|nr:hypothetical protein [Caldimonas sp.]